MKEEWKDIQAYPGLYQISNLGRVKSKPRQGTSGGVMKWTTHTRKHYFDGKTRQYKNHYIMLRFKNKNRTFTQKTLMKCYW